MSYPFTSEQQALVDSWFASESSDIQEIDDAIALAQEETLNVQLEDSIHATVETEALAEQLDLLEAKAADLGEDRFVEFLPAHPRQGGADPTAWQIYFMEIPEPPLPPVPTKVVEYSHSVNWDDNPDLLDQESIWNVAHDWRVNIYYGTSLRIAGLSQSVQSLTANRAAVLNRNAVLRGEDVDFANIVWPPTTAP